LNIHIIINVKEESGVCKDKVKWRAICGGRIKGGVMIMLLAYPVKGL
jgi:hypothetical protein